MCIRDRVYTEPGSTLWQSIGKVQLKGGFEAMNLFVRDDLVHHALSHTRGEFFVVEALQSTIIAHNWRAVCCDMKVRTVTINDDVGQSVNVQVFNRPRLPGPF